VSKPSDKAGTPKRRASLCDRIATPEFAIKPATALNPPSAVSQMARTLHILTESVYLNGTSHRRSGPAFDQVEMDVLLHPRVVTAGVSAALGQPTVEDARGGIAAAAAAAAAELTTYISREIDELNVRFTA
jgi:hypothetical protein